MNFPYFTISNSDEGGKLRCQITLSHGETCNGDTDWIRVHHDEKLESNLDSLYVQIDMKSQKEGVCLPHFIDIEKLKCLVISLKRTTFGETNNPTHFTASDSVLNMLRSLKFLKIFKFYQILFESIHESLLTKNFEIEELDISKSDIKILQAAEMLKNLPILKVLALTENYFITNIPKDFFQHNSELESITLRENEITILPESLLKNLKKLKKLFVTDNKITSIPDFFFSNNKQLEIIDFSNNLLQHSFRNQIVNLPSNLLKDLNKLKKVDFSKNQISSIPENFFSDNENLQWIEMSQNKISELPRTLLKGMSESLKEINLYDNRIKSISENYFTDNVKLSGRIRL